MQKRGRGKKTTAGELDREIGLLLADKRKRANLRQEDVANAIGFTLQQYQKYENGKDMLKLGTLFKIFDSLGMNDSDQDAFLKITREKNKEINK